MARGPATHDDRQVIYEREGVLHLPGVVPLADVERMRSAMWQGLLADGGLIASDPTSWTTGGALGLQDISGALRPGPGTRPILAAEAMRPVYDALDDALLAALAGVFGPGRWMISPQSRLAAPNFPVPGHEWPVPDASWHADEPSTTAEKSWGLLAFAFLDRVEPGGGPTVAVTGSARRLNRLAVQLDNGMLPCHQASTILARESWFHDLFRPDGSAAWRSDRFMARDHVSDGVPQRVVQLTGEPGDIALMDPRCLHTVSANTSSRPRLTVRMVCGRMAD